MGKQYDVAQHCFMSGDTLEAVIRRMNHHDLNKASREKLLNQFFEINGNGVPTIGQMAYIPVSAGFIGFDPTVKVITIEVDDNGRIHVINDG